MGASNSKEILVEQLVILLKGQDTGIKHRTAKEFIAVLEKQPLFFAGQRPKYPLLGTG